MSEDRASEVGDVAPSSLSHLIGQKSVIAQISVALDAAFADNKKVDHSLLVGPPGLGKSALARVIASEMAQEFHEILGQSISSLGDLNALLLATKDKDVLHIDEAHELGKEFQTALYLACDQRKIFINSSGKGRTPQHIPIADFTLLLSTTDEYCLLQPLRERMKLLLRFDFYSSEEIAQVVYHRSRALHWDVDERVLPEIARRSRGTPRLGLRLLQSCRRVCRAVGEQTITVDHLLRACELEQIDTLGLGPTEQRYLTMLAEGPTSRVTTRDITDFKDNLRRDQAQAVSTVNRCLVTIRRFFGWLVEQGVVPENPAKKVKELRRQPLAPKGLERSQVRRLLREIELRQDIRANAIFSLLLYTGCRVSDLVNLELTDLLIGDRSGSVVFRFGKGNKQRSVPLPLLARQALQTYLDTRPPVASRNVFIGERGPLTDRGVRALCDKYSAITGIKLHPHLFRHTMAHQFLADNGNDLVSLAQILGHESLNTTSQYSQRNEKQLADAADRLQF